MYIGHIGRRQRWGMSMFTALGGGAGRHTSEVERGKLSQLLRNPKGIQRQAHHRKYSGPRTDVSRNTKTILQLFRSEDSMACQSQVGAQIGTMACQSQVGAKLGMPISGWSPNWHANLGSEPNLACQSQVGAQYRKMRVHKRQHMRMGGPAF